MPGATYDPFDIVAVPFPFIDRRATKRRPALVLSTRPFKEAHEGLIAAMITTAAGEPWPSDTPLRDWRAAGLGAPCVVRARLFTIDKALIVRRLGSLGAHDRRMVGAQLSGALAQA